MKKSNFDKRIIELCEKREVKYTRDVTPSSDEYHYTISYDIVIHINQNEAEVWYKGRTYYFDWDSTIVRFRENVRGFEIKFDVSTIEGIKKLKLFAIGHTTIPLVRKQIDDPYEVLKENEGEWIRASDLAYMTNISRYGLATHVLDREGVETSLMYIGGKRSACYYRYVQKDSEPLSPEE